MPASCLTLSPDGTLVCLICGIIAVMFALQNMIAKLSQPQIPYPMPQGPPNPPPSAPVFPGPIRPPSEDERTRKAHYEWARRTREEELARKLHDTYLTYETYRQAQDFQGMEISRQRLAEMMQGRPEMEYYTRLWANAYGLC
jgi:hypothetical protein